MVSTGSTETNTLKVTVEDQYSLSPCILSQQAQYTAGGWERAQSTVDQFRDSLEQLTSINSLRGRSHMMSATKVGGESVDLWGGASRF